MNSINYFDVIEINELFGEGQLSLCCWLLESLTWLAITIAIVSTISSTELLCLVIVLSSSSDSTTPYDVKTVVIYGNVNILGCPSVQLEIIIIRLGIDEEALLNRASLDALRTLIAVAVTSTLCVLRVAVLHGATCETEPDGLCAVVSHLDHSLGEGH